MARRPSKHLRAPRPLISGHARAEERSDGRWIVRTVAGAAATKSYRCPGCSQSIPPSTPHLVVWPSEPTGWAADASPVAERRHWHTGCWSRRR